MELIDSHAHLDFPDFDNDLKEVIKRAELIGVKKIINVGSDLAHSQKAIRISHENENIWATVGVHPEEINETPLILIEKLRELSNLPKVVAIGECGLDYSYDEPKKGIQKALFKLQINLAYELNLPLVLHIRNGSDEQAVTDAYEIIKDNQVRGVIHCFSFGPSWAEKFINLGFYLGFTGIVTFKNALQVQESAKYVPLDRFLVETDCPYLAPQGHRGQRNEPAYVIEVAEKIAELKDLGIEEVAARAVENTENLFLKNLTK
jgi:TatD DNase family protein